MKHPGIKLAKALFFLCLMAGLPALHVHGREQISRVSNWRFPLGDPVDVTTNLTDWSTLWTTNSPAVPFGWIDTNASAFPSRFYRLLAGSPF